MQLGRLFYSDSYKGTKGYLASQKKYEIIRTFLYFAISLSLFIAGWVATGNRANLLTIVAVLGCLPASKSLVETIMYCRYKGCDEETAQKIEMHTDQLQCLYDCVFTSADKNFSVNHLSVKGNTICGYTSDNKFDENACYKHLDARLKFDHFNNTSIKIFTDLKKYTERLDQMQNLETTEANTEGILKTLKSISL